MPPLFDPTRAKIVTTAAAWLVGTVWVHTFVPLQSYLISSTVASAGAIFFKILTLGWGLGTYLVMYVFVRYNVPYLYYAGGAIAEFIYLYVIVSILFRTVYIAKMYVNGRRETKAVYSVVFATLCCTVLLSGAWFVRVQPQDTVITSQFPFVDSCYVERGWCNDIAPSHPWRNSVGSSPPMLSRCMLLYRERRCEHQPDGRCGWTNSAELSACIAKATDVHGQVEDVPQHIPPMFSVTELGVKFDIPYDLWNLTYKVVKLPGDQAVSTVAFSTVTLERAGCSAESAPLGYLTYRNDKGGVLVGHARGDDLYYLPGIGRCPMHTAAEQAKILEETLRSVKAIETTQ